LREAVIDALVALRSELPLGLANAVDQALGRLLDLPAEMQEEAPFELSRPRAPTALVLPAWMPPNRVIGGFYVRRLLGSGGVGSVFVVCRVEDRSRRHPAQFAMKVPEYGPDVAHTLSETEFLDMFRGEAGALLSVPAHPNLARFVTFDVGARPKPILVMELVEGPTLQRLIQTRVLKTSQALTILDGVAAGLEAMHAIGLGHLDVKPGNVILRASEARVCSPDLDVHFPRTSRAPSDDEATPVLVDFGLAGRKIRPGCATAAYGAPEIWGYSIHGLDPAPMPADVYAFACMAYETLTGEELFRDANHLAVIVSHVEHDGNPAGLRTLWSTPALAGLGNVLSWGLRRDPRMRCSISELRRGIAQLGLERWPWPVA
jgi:serine/threonine protein kinase